MTTMTINVLGTGSGRKMVRRTPKSILLGRVLQPDIFG